MLMATSAVGPGFLTQSAIFSAEYMARLAIVIVLVIAMDMITQYNVWSVIGVSELRAQEIADRVLPGTGRMLSLFVAFGGLVFNIGNVGGISLGLFTIFGIDPKIGCLIGGGTAVCIFLSKSANRAMDRLAQVIACIIVIVLLIVAKSTAPQIFATDDFMFFRGLSSELLIPLITLLGGSCGGYISFAGAHRLIDAGICGKKDLSDIHKSVIMGTSVSGTVRILMYIATFGVCLKIGRSASQEIAEAKNPAAEIFQLAAGKNGAILFGIVLICAGLSSVVGAAYTSISFVKTSNKVINDHERLFVVIFILISTAVMSVYGNAAKLLLMAGAVNGLILPVSLSVILIASGKAEITGKDYKHNVVLKYFGYIIVLLSAIASIRTITGLFVNF